MLREKQIAFCNEYIRCRNAALAAKKAGYNPDYGRALLERPDITDFCRRQGLAALEEQAREAGLEVTKPTECGTDCSHKAARSGEDEKKSRVTDRKMPSQNKKKELGKKLSEPSQNTCSFEKKEIATAEDVLKFLTDIMEGEEALRDRLRAAELLGKRYGLFKDAADGEEKGCLVIVGEDKL